MRYLRILWAFIRPPQVDEPILDQADGLPFVQIKGKPIRPTCIQPCSCSALGPCFACR